MLVRRDVAQSLFGPEESVGGEGDGMLGVIFPSALDEIVNMFFGSELVPA